MLQFQHNTDASNYITSPVSSTVFAQIQLENQHILWSTCFIAPGQHLGQTSLALSVTLTLKSVGSIGMLFQELTLLQNHYHPVIHVLNLFWQYQSSEVNLFTKLMHFLLSFKKCCFICALEATRCVASHCEVKLK